MTIRDIFRLMLKLFGLYYLIVNLFSIPSYFSFLFYDFNFLQVFGVIMLGLALISLYLYILFTPDRIIDLFKLDRGFDDAHVTAGNIDSQGLLKLGVVIIGGLFFLNNAGYLLVNSYTLFKSSIGYNSIGGFVDDYLEGAGSSSKVSIAVNILNLIVSWLLITNCDRISKYLMGKTV